MDIAKRIGVHWFDIFIMGALIVGALAPNILLVVAAFLWLHIAMVTTGYALKEAYVNHRSYNPNDSWLNITKFGWTILYLQPLFMLLWGQVYLTFVALLVLTFNILLYRREKELCTGTQSA
jgi:hypothetical protein